MKHGSVKIDPTSIPYNTWTEIEMKLSLNISVLALTTSMEKCQSQDLLT